MIIEPIIEPVCWTEGIEYTGMISHTGSGKQCQYWTDTFPHTPDYIPEDSNFCRNPGI